jgi:hypothetical protein
VVVELDDLDRLGEGGPVRVGGRDGLVVVEDGDAVRAPGLLDEGLLRSLMGPATAPP